MSKIDDSISYIGLHDYMRARLVKACELEAKNTEICHMSFWLRSVPWYAGEALPWPRFQNISDFKEYCSRYTPVIDLADELQKAMIP